MLRLIVSVAKEGVGNDEQTRGVEINNLLVFAARDPRWWKTLAVELPLL